MRRKRANPVRQGHIRPAGYLDRLSSDDEDHRQQAPARQAAREGEEVDTEQPEELGPATRIALQPVERDTGEFIEPAEIVKGYEFEHGQYVTFTPAELKALDVQSSKTIDLE